MSLFRNEAGVGFENRWCWRWDAECGNRFRTGLESEFAEVPMFLPKLKFLPDEVDAESIEDSIEGNGSRSSRLRVSKGGGVRDLCKGDAAYE
jgi:hypothetical protein